MCGRVNGECNDCNLPFAACPVLEKDVLKTFGKYCALNGEEFLKNKFNDVVNRSYSNIKGSHSSLNLK